MHREAMTDPDATADLEVDADDGTVSALAANPRRVAGALWWGLLAGATLAVLVVAWYWRPPTRLPVLRELPAFALIDQTGRPFGTAELDGKIWVACFVFTRCRNACPGMTGELARVQSVVREREALADHVRLVSFSVDPGHDTVERLAEFGKTLGADEHIWRFLTGDRASIVAICESGFGLAAGGGGPAPSGASARESPSPPHSDRFALVDAHGRVRGFYRPTADEADFARLIEHLEALVVEIDRGGER